MTRSEAGKLGAIKGRVTQLAQLKERVRLYSLNPKLCKECSRAFEYTELRDHKIFCNRSCAAIYNNRLKPKKEIKCSICSSLVKKGGLKFCSNKCQQIEQWNIKKQTILKNGCFYNDGKDHSNFGPKRYLKEVHGIKCSICNITHWQNKEVPLVMDHIDGNSTNWKLDNLRLVCGNCDMQLPTYKAKNKGNGRAWRKERYRAGKSF